jgi:MoaA/NifB/PqqE/SkfB family radical SAM enzyme
MQRISAMEPNTGTHPTILPLIPVSGAAEPRTQSKRPPTFEVGRAGRVIIEIVGICQAKCPYCAQNSGKNRRHEKPQAYMPVEMFRNIISRLAASEAFVTRRIDRVYLYNWGEPFLAPQFNEYLEILKEHRLYAVVSSNFQKVPIIKAENLSVINEVLFSLSGMSDGTYGRIHGGPIDKVLANFEAFNRALKQHSPHSKVFMSWHRYRFNEHEFWKAYGYSRQQGIGFIPSVAFLNDLAELIQAASDRLPGQRKEAAQRDLFFEHMVNTIGQYKASGGDYDCPAWDDVVVDERGRLLICCGTDSQSSVGGVFDLTFDEMRNRKIRSGLCKVCKDSGVAEWAHNNFHDRNQMPWPAGGRSNYLRLKWTYNKLKIKSDVRHVLNNVPFGEALLGVYRKARDFSVSPG